MAITFPNGALTIVFHLPANMVNDDVQILAAKKTAKINVKKLSSLYT